MPMNAVLGISPGMGTSLEGAAARALPQRVQELGGQLPDAGLGDRTAEPDGPVRADVDPELAARHPDGIRPPVRPFLTAAAATAHEDEPEASV